MILDLLKVRKLMKESGLDCIIATTRENVYYCSGADVGGMGLRIMPVILPLDSDPVFLVHPSGSGAGEEKMVRRISWIKDIRTYSGGEWAPLEVWKQIADVIKEKKLNAAKIGLESYYIPYPVLDYLRKEKLPSADFIDAQLIFDKMRSVKSQEEIKILTDINMATAKAMAVAFEMARPGDTESQIAKNMMNLLLEYGAEKIKNMMLAAGPYISEPHHVSGDYKIKKGDLIHVDGGGFLKGYGSDLSRMAVVGEPSKKQQEAYKVVIKQMRDAADAMRNGVKVIEVHKVAKQSYESQTGTKYPRFFIGHSTGIGGHEYPMLGPFHGDWVLEPGMYFQMEPSHVASPDIRVHYEDSVVTQAMGPAKIVSEYRDTSELFVIK
jgi:Xaa-Pro aminopeptidase